MSVPSAILAVSLSARSLVMPFENLSQDPAEAWMGAILAETIESHIAAAGGEVVSVEALNQRLLDKGFEPAETLTRATAIVLGQELGCERVIVGSYERAEERISVVARVIDLEQGVMVGVIEDYAEPATSAALNELSNQIAKNLFRLEADRLPALFAELAKRRLALPPAALEASGWARLSLDPVEKRHFLENAVRTDPQYLEARSELGRLLVEAGEPRPAIDMLVAVPPRGKLFQDAYFHLGLAYLDVGEPSMAAEVFLNLTELTERASYYNNLGVAQMRGGGPEAAAGAFERAVELAPADPVYLFNLGWSHWRAGKGAPALERFRRAAELSPVDGEANWMLSAAAASQALEEEAEKRRRMALALEPELGELDPGTVERLERVVRDPHRSVSVSDDWGLDTGEVVAMDRLLAIQELRARGNTEEAIHRLQKELYLDPRAIEPRRELAELYRETGDLAKAAGEFRILLWQEPDVELYIELARIYIELDRLEEAREQAELARALDPDHEDVRLFFETYSVPASPPPP